MTDTIGHAPNHERREQREQQIAQLQAEIAAACETIYHTLAEMEWDDVEPRRRFIQESQGRMAEYRTALGAFIGVAEAEEALDTISARAFKREVERVRNSERPERCRTLWILVCCESRNAAYELVPFYAVNAEDAEQRVQKWLDERPHALIRIDLREYPRGFMMGRSMLDGLVI